MRLVSTSKRVRSVELLPFPPEPVMTRRTVYSKDYDMMMAVGVDGVVYASFATDQRIAPMSGAYAVQAIRMMHSLGLVLSSDLELHEKAAKVMNERMHRRQSKDKLNEVLEVLGLELTREQKQQLNKGG